MAHQDEHDRGTKRFHYPLDPNSYQILDQIGRGCSAIVYKALCTTTSAIVAIKSIDLDRTTTDDFDNVRREAKTMSLLSHPNVLKAHCSFTVGRRLWVVMPFMSAGSLQSIMASSFPNGISEPCISIILKEALMGLCYLHDQGHLHRDIKAGNILMDSSGSIKLADFGVSASVYESSSRYLMLNEITGTPYWMAPEVIHSYNGYSYKADIWSFGITALELAHGRPPLSHLPFSESLVMKITKGLRFSDYQKDEEKGHKNPKFSKYFKDMVGLCLDQDPLRRPTAEKLLKHYFFKNCKGCDFLVKNVLRGLPSVELRFNEAKLLQRVGSMSKLGQHEMEEDENEEEFLIGSNMTKHRRISGWNFNVDACELDPVFPLVDTSPQDDFVKQIPSGGETMISEKMEELDVNKASSPSVDGDGEVDKGGGVDREVVVGSLMALKKSLDDQREKVVYMLAMAGAEETAVGDGEAENGNREEQLMQVIQKLRSDLENEKRKRTSMEMELEVFKLHITNT
ncbi:serine/threonine-protein kinase BLUS1 [Cynara cardunculus var. scolymus]|uniref:serine/threonine-protein kinase BLUS1 n=1 Tax=Cynara cardunculus var. scolymus TaxID=59895 RepID=UPI000D623C9A|nr:serine/threonine-protein kinase BLUS1 [Cynara cardunculus var. scolymus]